MWYTYSMNDRFVKIGEAAKILGVNPQTLRRWEEGGVIQPAKRTPKGTRLYSLQELLGVNDLAYRIAYARVQSKGVGLREKIIRCMNYNKKGLLRLLELIVRGQMSRLVTHTKTDCSDLVRK